MYFIQALFDINYCNLPTDIPGFYYDVEKKKYFRIVPGQNNQNAKVVTRESIKQKKAEDIRQQKIKSLLFPRLRRVKGAKDSKDKEGAISTVTKSRNLPRCNISCNIYELVDGVRTGNLQTNQPAAIGYRYMDHLVTSLIPRGMVKVFKEPSNIYEKLEHFRQMSPSPDHKKLLCLWSLRDVVTQRIQVLDVKSVACHDEEGVYKIDIAPTGNILYQHNSKVTNICWAPASTEQENNENRVLFTTTCFMGTNPSMASLRCLNPDSQEELTDTFHLGRQATWTCAWNVYGQQLSVGSEGCSLLLDVTTRRLWELNTRGSNVFSQAFSPQVCMQ